MYQSDTEMLFPMRVAPELRELRGKTWRDLVDGVLATSEASEERLAFSLVIIQLAGCLTCHTDSYRAMRGCTICSRQAVRRFRGEDKQLLDMYDESMREIHAYLKGL